MNIRTWIGARSIALGAMVAVGCGDHNETGPTVGSIVLQLEADTISVGRTTHLQATVLSVDGDTLTGETSTFTSNNEDIITVSNTGLLMGVGPGTATITGHADDHFATVTVFVRRAAMISVAPSDTTVLVYDDMRLTVTVLDADGIPVVNPVLNTSTSNYLVIAGDPIDGFSTQGVGNAVITVETEGLAAQAHVKVVQPVRTVTLLPASLTIGVGGTSQLTVIVQDTAGVVIADSPLVFGCDSCFTNNEDFTIISLDLDNTGLVTGLSQGSVKVFARSRGVVSDTIQVTVQ